MRLLLLSVPLAVALLGCESAEQVPDPGCSGQYLPDSDGDGFPGMGDVVVACEPPLDYVSVEVDFDCDDADPAIHPEADEHCDGLDENCNLVADEWPVDGFTYFVDYDEDGFGNVDPIAKQCEPLDDPTVLEVGGDCDDNDPEVNPDAVETCDGVDEDCNGVFDDGMQTGTFYQDWDEDGFGTGSGVEACVAPAWHAPLPDDCDDEDPEVNPGAPERCNDIDDDCDGTTDDERQDLDGDGFSACDGDCDDTAANALPGGTEVCDDVDNDCSGVINDFALDAYEPNGTRDEAPVVCGDNEQVTFTATISGPDDRSDWYRIDTIDDPDNVLNGDAFFTTVTISDLPPGVEASLHLYRRRDVGANPIRRIRTDDTWEDGVLTVTHDDGFWLSNDGNEHWAQLEVHSGYDCDASYTVTIANGG